MADLASVLKIATRMHGLGITRRQSRDRVRRLVREADGARDRKDWPEASRLYQQVLELDPSKHGIRVQLGHAYKEQGDLASAGLCYHAALQLAPLDDDIYLQIGHLEKLKGNLGEAALAYRKAAELNPLNADAVGEYAALTPALGSPAARVGSALPIPVTANGSSNSPIAVELQRRVAASELRARGDQARDGRRWSEAASAYQAYLQIAPDDFSIWIQLGHALKESGDPAGSEGAYRSALALNTDDADADLADAHLHLGHVLKLRGRTEDAIEAYRRSFELHPLRRAFRELAALDRATDELVLRTPTAVERPAEILLDISDLLVVLNTWDSISGIQRVQLGLVSSLLSDPSGPGCRFVMWRNKELWVVPERLLASLVPDGTATAPGFQRRQPLIAEIEAQSALYAPVAGDVVVSTGVIYYETDLIAQREQLKCAGVRLGAYFHDFIPLTHPEFCAEILINAFSRTASEALLHLDFVLTVSEHVASETRRLLKQAGYPAVPVRAVPLAHSFGGQPEADRAAADHWTPTIAALQGREYVLCVGTRSVHKNQSFLVQVWDLLVREGYDPPLLVLAGSQNFGADEIAIRLSWTNNVGGRVRVVDTPSDEELAVLYRNCLFTMFPSIVEGWGLPIGESLVNGKLCIASRLASMPEVGGEYALYVDPYNVRACADLLRDLLSDRATLSAHEARIRSHFKARTWHEHGRDFLAAVKEGVEASAKAGERRLGALAPSQAFRPRSLPQEWEFGNALPDYRAFAEVAKARMVLVRGWRAPESWGTWMAGRYARLSFFTTAAPGSIVTVLLQCRAAPWSRHNTLCITAACGARVSVPVPETGSSEASWRGGRYRELVVGIDCAVGKDGSISLLLEITGLYRTPWWGESRSLCIGLVRVAYLPAEGNVARLLPNRRIRPAALTDASGNAVYPVGLQSMLAVLRANQLLAAGWDPPEAGRGAWMLGATARLTLSTELSAGERTRVVLQLRTVSGPAAVPVTIAAECGASSVWRLPEGSPTEWAWLDCRVGADGRIVLEITDPTWSSRVPGRRIGLISIAYGRRDTTEDRLALTEAMLYPAPADPGSLHSTLLADLRFTIAGHITGSYSLAAINRSLAAALEAACPGAVRIEQIETDPVRDLNGVPAAERDAIARLAARGRDIAGAEVAIVQHWPVLPPPSCDLPLALFAWEESLVPRDIVEHFNRHYRGMIAQTNAVRKALVDSGIAIPVHMVGCAIDLSRFAAIGERRAAAGRPAVSAGPPFVFLHVSSCFPRKGVDVLLAAYAEAFRRDDPVRLVIKGFPNPHNDVAQRIERLRAADPNLPPIELIDEDLDEEALLRLYETADAMVLPTRGEGFNMPAAEAMAAGLPLIVTAYGGQADFVDPAVARVIDYEFAASQSHVRPPGSVWVEPDRADLVAALRETAATARGTNGAGGGVPSLVERARRAVLPLGDRAEWGRRVAEAACRLLTADPPRGMRVGWVSSWKLRCGIAEYSRHLLTHFENASKDVTVFCDARTEPDQLLSHDGPRAQIAWRKADEPSMDDLAAAIDRGGVDAVIVQHHDGDLFWEHLAAFLRDGRVACRPVLVFLHHARDLFKFDAGNRANIIDALRLAERVLVHSVSDLNILKSFGLVDNVTLFPHGAERVDLAPRSVQSFASGGVPLLGAYGFFLPHKGFDRLIRALPALRARWSGLRLRLVTAEHEDPLSAEEIERCKQLARTVGVADTIEWFNDYLPNQRSLELLNECDLVVLPYQDTTESASGAARVAIASRAPVAVTPIRIFEDLDDAVLRLDGGGVDDIASGIAAILHDAERRRAVIDKAGLWLESHDWRLLASRLHGMVSGIVATARTI